MNDPIQFQPGTAATRARWDWGELTWFANREQGNSTEMTVGRCVLRPGYSNPRHHHPNCTEILTVISGRIRHTVAGDEVKEMGPDDTVTIPPRVWHHATNIGEVDAVLYIAFSSADRLTVGE